MASKSGPTNSEFHTADGASRKCLCSPTNHPGSFRCSFHRNRRKISARASSSSSIASNPKGNALRAILLQIKSPSSDLHRRKDFHPRPSRPLERQHLRQRTSRQAYLVEAAEKRLN